MFIERREIEKKKKALKEEMEEIQRNTAELREKRRTQEKVLNDMFNMLIEQEIKREKELVQDNKVSNVLFVAGESENLLLW